VRYEKGNMMMMTMMIFVSEDFFPPFLSFPFLSFPFGR
jgi:hypothetical protein